MPAVNNDWMYLAVCLQTTQLLQTQDETVGASPAHWVSWTMGQTPKKLDFLKVLFTGCPSSLYVLNCDWDHNIACVFKPSISIYRRLSVVGWSCCCHRKLWFTVKPAVANTFWDTEMIPVVFSAWHCQEGMLWIRNDCLIMSAVIDVTSLLTISLISFGLFICHRRFANPF